MNTAMQLFSGNSVIPAHVAEAFADNENVLARESTPALTFRGKTWRVRLGGEETPLMRVNSDGEQEASPLVKVIVLNVNPKRSRVFYPGAYAEGTNASPVCWASDGERPDKDVKEPCAATCAACPNSVKGSKITANNKETTACSTVKRLVVVPAAKLDMPPLLLKVPQTSMWDKNNSAAEAAGYFAWDQYVDMLRQRGVKHTAQLVTKIKFDTNVAYPKLLFTADRWLDDTEARTVVPLVNSEAVVKLMSGRIIETVQAASEEDEDTPVATPTVAPVARPVQAAPKAVTTPPVPAAPPPAPVQDDEDDGFGAASAATAPTPAAQQPVPVAAAPKAPKPPKVTPPPAPPAPKAPPTVAAAGNPDLAALAAEWDD